MRISDLQLAAFGPFDDVALDLSADGLHLIYGPNEAGKTSALRAIESFLFGIPHNSPDNFRHDYTKLRVGATLVGADGESLRLFRRKGNKNTLLDADGKAVDDARLAPILGGLSHDVWRALFSLTRAEVEQGNADILAGRGHLGEALFSAGLGGASVNRVLAALQSEAESLYRKSGSKPRINELKAAHDDLRKRLAESQLSFARWDGARRAVEQAESECLRLREELARLRATQQTLERRILARGAAESRRRALRELEHHGIADALFAKAGELAALGRQSGEYRKQRDAMPALEASARNAETAWHAQGNRLFPGRDAAETPGLSRADEENLKVLARLCIEAERTVAGHRKRIDEGTARLRGITASLEDAGAGLADSVAPLKALVDEGTAAGDLDAALAGESKGAAKLEKEIASSLAALGLWSGDASSLAALPVPPEATLERFEGEGTAARDQVAAAAREVERIETELGAASTECEILAAGSDTPTPDALAAKRASRDAQWLEIHARWKAGQAPEGEPPLEHTFPASIAEADQLADRMRSDSRLVERRLQAHRAVARLETALAEARNSLAHARDAAEESANRWKAEWAACGIEPRPPREMRAWLRNRSDILEKAARLDDAMVSIGETAAKREQLRARLSAALGDENADLGALLAAGKARVTEATRTEGARRQLAKQTADTGAELELARGEATRAEEECDRARAAWKDALPRGGLSPDTLPEAGLVLADDLAALGRLNHERRRAAEAVEAARATVANFEQAVNALAGATGCGESGLAHGTLFDLLEARLQRGLELRQEMATAEARLHDALPESEALGDFAESLLADGESAAESELLATRDRLHLAEAEHHAAIEALTIARRDLAGMNGRDDAARLEEERQNVLAELRAHAARYATLVAAREILRQAVERFREENQGPVLARARACFRILTLGAFSDLRVGYNDRDEPVLRAIRAADGTEVSVEGLSEGTRDQFYLALRLAGLEHYIAAHDPAPLLVDDILITFDDARATAVLTVLGELARHTQVVLFTHHEHLLGLAEKALGPHAIHPHRLGTGAPAIAG